MSNSHTATHHRISRAAHTVENHAEEAADQVQEGIHNLKERALHIRDQVQAKVKSTEGTIKEHPWASVGVAAAAGVGIGLLIGLFARRTRD